MVSWEAASGTPRLQIFPISAPLTGNRRKRRLPRFLTKWDSRTATENTCPSPEAIAAPTTPIFIGKMNSQSRKIFAPAPTHIPTKDKAGEPSFRTKTDRQVLISMGTEKAQ